jgi:hypothetical protein
MIAFGYSINNSFTVADKYLSSIVVQKLAKENVLKVSNLKVDIIDGDKKKPSEMTLKRALLPTHSSSMNPLYISYAIGRVMPTSNELCNFSYV